MNLSIRELNELIYSLGIATHNGSFVNKEINESLLEKLYSELNSKIAEEAIDEEVEENYLTIPSNNEVKHIHIEEDAFTKVLKSKEEVNIDEYVEGTTEDGGIYKKERGYVTQAILDYVDRKGAVSHGDLESYYKSITGSNSFSHVLQSLRTPYKNRKTQRYIAKEGRKYSDALYVIKVANPSNWVVASK